MKLRSIGTILLLSGASLFTSCGKKAQNLNCDCVYSIVNRGLETLAERNVAKRVWRNDTIFRYYPEKIKNIPSRTKPLNVYPYEEITYNDAIGDLYSRKTGQFKEIYNAPELPVCAKQIGSCEDGSINFIYK